MADPFKVSVRGPLVGLVPSFREELFRLGYASDTVAQQLRLIAGLSRWLADRKMVVGDLSDSVMESFMDAWRGSHVNRRTTRALGPFVGFLDKQGIDRVRDAPGVISPIDRMLGDFARYLTFQRALRPATVENYLNQTRPFLRWRQERHGEDWATLSADEITEFLLKLAQRQSIGSVRVAGTGIRALLRWMFLTGVTPTRLDGAVGPVADSSYAGLPKALSGEQLQSITHQASASGERATRNVALVAVLSRLGLRAGEAAALTLEDIDWRGGTITVQGKGGRPTVMPLPADVGAALVNYLRTGRPPTKDRHVFVRSLAPHRFMTSSGISQVISTLGAKAGIIERIGAHRLRHTAATAILSAGGNLTEASQLLRHTDRATTQIYAKVDLHALRQLARPWPTTLVLGDDRVTDEQVAS